MTADRHIFNQYVIRVSQRDELQAHSSEEGCGDGGVLPGAHAPAGVLCIPGQRAGAFPESERAAKETLALPIYPELLDVQARFVVESIQEFYTQLQAPLLASESVARSAGTQPRAAAE